MYLGATLLDMQALRKAAENLKSSDFSSSSYHIYYISITLAPPLPHYFEIYASMHFIKKEQIKLFEIVGCCQQIQFLHTKQGK